MAWLYPPPVTAEAQQDHLSAHQDSILSPIPLAQRAGRPLTLQLLPPDPVDSVLTESLNSLLPGLRRPLAPLHLLQTGKSWALPQALLSNQLLLQLTMMDAERDTASLRTR